MNKQQDKKTRFEVKEITILLAGMVAGVLLALFAFDISGIYNGTRICDLGIFWTAFGSLGTILALVWAIHCYNSDSAMQKQQRTIEAYLPIREEYYELTLQTVNSTKLERDKLLKEYLSKMEILAAGVNSGAYSIDYINRISGGKLVRQYTTTTKCYISNIQKTKPQNNIAQDALYCEYATMIKKLFELRGEPWEN